VFSAGIDHVGVIGLEQRISFARGNGERRGDSKGSA
jgi:hypothetical protein